MIDRARSVLIHLESKEDGKIVESVKEKSVVSEKGPDPLREKIRSIDINHTTPLEALMLLEALKEDVDA